MDKAFPKCILGANPTGIGPEIDVIHWKQKDVPEESAHIDSLVTRKNRLWCRSSAC